ncbi:MAG: hypothetical protein ACRDRZ_04145 [Pseudonocardiaceae bacterium]
MILAGLRWGRCPHDHQVHAFPAAAPASTRHAQTRCGHTVPTDAIELTPGPEQTLCLACAGLIGEQLAGSGREFGWFAAT